MTVAELIEQLKNLPPNARVICGFIDGSKWEIGSAAVVSTVIGPSSSFVELSCVFDAYRDPHPMRGLFTDLMQAT